MNDSFKIDFVGIGAAKAGTTWLGHMIADHPQLCLSELKEVHFFNDRSAFRSKSRSNFSKGISWYRKYFKHCSPQSLKGEITPRYFTDPVVPQRLKALNPQVKILVCIRNPVDRIYSHYLFAKHFGQKEDRPILQAIQEERQYLDDSRYHQNISLYLEHFAREQFFFVWFDDIKDRPSELLSELYAFLGVDPSYRPERMFDRSNWARQSRIFWLNDAIVIFMSWMVSLGMSGLLLSLKKAGMKELVTRMNSKPIQIEPMPREVKAFIISRLKEDVGQLEKLLGRDLQHWLTLD